MDTIYGLRLHSILRVTIDRIEIKWHRYPTHIRNRGPRQATSAKRRAKEKQKKRRGEKNLSGGQRGGEQEPVDGQEAAQVEQEGPRAHVVDGQLAAVVHHDALFQVARPELHGHVQNVRHVPSTAA